MNYLVGLLGAEVGEAGVVDELVHVLEGEDLASGGEQELFHVFAADAEAAAGNAGDHFESGVTFRAVFRAERAEVLDSRHLVAGRTVVFSELRLDDDVGIEFVRDHEIRRLVESGQSLRPLRLAETDAGSRQLVLDGVFDKVADQFADGIAVARERAPEKAFVEKDGVGDSQMCRRTDADKSGPGIRLVQSVEVAESHFRYARFEDVTGCGDEGSNPPFRHGSFLWQGRFGIHADVPVDRAHRSLCHFDAGVAARVPGPLGRREPEHAAKDDEHDRGFEHDGTDRVRGDCPEALGRAFQGFVSFLEYRELDEPFALRHDQELRF